MLTKYHRIMKSKASTGLLLAVLMSLSIACNTKIPAPANVVVDKEKIKKEIQAKEDQFAEIYNSGELRRIGYYAEDATSYAPNRAPLVGREDIIEYLKVDVESNTDKISFTTREVFVSNDGNMVVELGHYQVVDSTGTPFNTGNYMCLFEKRNDQYYCVRDMSVSDIPLE